MKNLAEPIGRNPGRRAGSHRRDRCGPDVRIGVPENRLYEMINEQRGMIPPWHLAYSPVPALIYG